MDNAGPVEDRREDGEIRPGDRVRVLRNRYGNSPRPWGGVERHFQLAPGDTIIVKETTPNYVTYSMWDHFTEMILRKDVELAKESIDMKTNIKPGDRVRIICNTVYAYKQGKDSPEELLRPGEIITVFKAENKTIFYDTERGRYNTIPIKDVELAKEDAGTSTAPQETTVEDTPSKRSMDASDKVFLVTTSVAILIIPCGFFIAIPNSFTTLSQKGHIMTDALLNITNDPVVHDAIISLIVGGRYLVLGTMAFLFLKNVAVNLAKYGDRRRRLRLEDEERATKRDAEAARRESEDHDRFVQSEARKKQTEATYIAEIVRASLTSQPSGTGAVSEGRPPEILPEMWVKFVALPHTTIRRLPESSVSYQSVPIKIGDCVQVRSVDRRTRSMVYDPGQGESLHRVPLDCVVPV